MEQTENLGGGTCPWYPPGSYAYGQSFFSGVKVRKRLGTNVPFPFAEINNSLSSYAIIEKLLAVKRLKQCFRCG